MSNIAEIEAAIEKLPDPQVAQLAHWLEQLRRRRTTLPPVESWLKSDAARYRTYFPKVALVAP